MLSFEHIDYLWFLAVVIPLVVLFYFLLRWKRKAAKTIGDEELVIMLTKDYSPKRFRVKFILVITALIVVVFSLANLRKPGAASSGKKAGIDVLVALDVSNSMLSEDVKPSRLEKAKLLVNLLINELDNNRVGLVLFAGKAYLQMPLTSDLSAARMYVSNADPSAISVQGTVFSEALQLCGNALDTKEKKFKAVVLISDGEDHDPESLPMADQLKEQGIIVYTVGIGTAKGAPITEPGSGSYKRDAQGQTVITKLNEKELQDIAKQTYGTYFHLENPSQTASQIAASLGKMDKNVIEMGGGSRQYTSFFPFFILVAILLLVIELFIPEIKKEKS